MQVSNSDQTARHISIPSRSRRKNGIKFKLRLVPIFGRSAAAQQNMPRYRLMGSHQRFSVLVAKYGATTNALQPERHSRYRYSFVDVRRNALRRRQIGVKLICSGSWTKYPEAVLRRSRLARGIRLSSDSAVATSREDRRSPRSGRADSPKSVMAWVLSMAVSVPPDWFALVHRAWLALGDPRSHDE
jgi:hypothetical protein